MCFQWRSATYSGRMGLLRGLKFADARLLNILVGCIDVVRFGNAYGNIYLYCEVAQVLNTYILHGKIGTIIVLHE